MNKLNLFFDGKERSASKTKKGNQEIDTKKLIQSPSMDENNLKEGLKAYN